MFSEQTPYCDDKIAWLLDNGYEVGNHTLNHQSLYNVEDDVFRSEIGGAIQALQEHDPRVEANIIAMTFGDYPDLETRANQREWLRNGFEYDGETVQLIGALMVGAEPAYSPVSTEWDPVFIARIQSGTQNEYGYTAYWFDRFEEAPWSLYRSDGNPATITVPEDLPATMDGTLNVDRIEADGLELIRY
jgi:peptidoglycan/xylan/chitin deacetylase (PgdA/CDA1 family)